MTSAKVMNEGTTSEPVAVESATSSAVQPGNSSSIIASGAQPTERMNGGVKDRHQQRQPRPKKTQKCKFFNTKKGCRAGEACPFLHVRDEQETLMSPATTSADVAKQSTTADSKTITVKNETIPPFESSNSTKATPALLAQQAQPTSQTITVAKSRVVERPTPAAAVRDPRKFQITQLKTRFSAEESSDGITTLTFKMAPSDPDFPFDIEALQCVLQIPATFPAPKAPPRLRITNAEMERGFQINVERGFDAIWSSMTNPTLLGAFKALDRRLEEVLTAPKAETIKLVINSGPVRKTEAVSSQPDVSVTVPVSTSASVQPTASTSATSSAKLVSSTPSPPQSRQIPTSPHLIAQARVRREAEISILTHRLGRAALFASQTKPGGTAFTIPVEPRKRSALPIVLQSLKTVRLFVPDAYAIEPCRIELLRVDGDAARNVEAAFARVVSTKQEATLLERVNYLAQNMHVMAAEEVGGGKEQDTGQTQQPPHTAPAPAPVTKDMSTETIEKLDVPITTKPAKASVMFEEEQDSHIKYIPRPPEWSTSSGADHAEDDDHTSSSYTDSSSDDEGYTSLEDGTADEESSPKDQQAADTTSSTTPREKGVLISFPHLELHSIELLELTLPSITVKCERCKDTMDFARIKNNERGDYTGIRSESCKKCAFSFSIGYRKDIMHANSTRAGYLDLDGCTIVDLLPSLFTPTCSTCSTPYPTPPGVTAVRGDSALAICRECHSHLSFRLPEVKFLRIGSSADLASARGLPLKKKPPRENLGIVAGQELPSRGRCPHYGKSYRWFRFSCCGKVYPCDRCHDASPESSDHPNEFANRMICGFCSREQNYRPLDCAVCRRELTGRARSGFWEGGKGTRDKSRMSRKDPRKYKRRGGSAVGAAKK